MQRPIQRELRVTYYDNCGFPIDPPMRVVSLKGCVHEVVSDAPVGEYARCKHCGNVRRHVRAVTDFIRCPEFSHITIRSSAANRCKSWESYHLFQVEPESPTQCILAMTAPVCDEVTRAIEAAGARAVPGPSRGKMALEYTPQEI